MLPAHIKHTQHKYYMLHTPKVEIQTNFHVLLLNVFLHNNDKSLTANVKREARAEDLEINLGDLIALYKLIAHVF